VTLLSVSIVNVGIGVSFSCCASLAALRVMTWITPVGPEVKSNLQSALSLSELSSVLPSTLFGMLAFLADGSVRARSLLTVAGWDLEQQPCGNRPKRFSADPHLSRVHLRARNPYDFFRDILG
jgi:hypothetical protein